MKLGDSMAPIEACSVWNDVCPRKTRPPKIGDIPRHVAVDEESPGCSSSRSLGQFNETKSSKSMLERTARCQSEHERSKLSEALPVIQDYIKSNFSTRFNRKTTVNIDDIESKPAETIERSSNKATIDKNFNDFLPKLDELSKNLAVKNQLEILQKNSSLRIAESADPRDDELTWENDIPEKIYEVRKDSALYLDECHVEGLTPRHGLPEIGGESRTLGVSLGSCEPREKIEESVGDTRFPGRARRESSGYFSNLGTFDEDRWITSTMDLGNHQQDHITTRDINRERRRSSTKNRLPLIHNQQQQQSTVQAAFGTACGQQFTIKIPNNVSPIDQIEEISQSSLPSDFSSVTKMLRLEMPNIQEQTSLELDKSINFDSIDANEISAESRDINDDLTNEMSQLALGKIANNGDASVKIWTSLNDKETSDASVDSDSTVDSEEKISNQPDATCQWIAKTSSKPRRRMIAHQFSSPNITNSELERIMERPFGEIVDRKNVVESHMKIDENPKPRTSEIVRVIVNEDENDEVVTGSSEYEINVKVLRDEDYSRKILPKSIKVYQLLSTQSEDRGDGDPRIYDRRISLQITRNNEDVTIRETGKNYASTEQRNDACLPDKKKLVHADSVPLLKIPGSSGLANPQIESRDGTIIGTDTFRTLGALSSSGESGLCIDRRTSAIDKPSGSSIAGARPIYPYCPYSPYASPHGSPRTNRRRPLRESRRVSIDSRQGALQLNQYKLLNNIGQGSYGIVKLAYNEEDETHYAMKILSKKKLMKKAGIFGRIAPGRKGNANPLAKVYREIALLKKLDHPNVVKLVEVLDDPDEDNLYLVFELVEKGEVLQLPTDKPLDEETARRHFRDVVMGVEYLHYQRIVHRDIKPSNLLVDSEGRVKVADLGVSAELRAAGELLSGSAGTPAFAAPETTTPGAQYSGTLCDVWSMGVTLYSLVTGKVPWDGAGSIISAQAAVRSEQLRFPERPVITKNLRDLITRMLAKDPQIRIDLAEIKEHRWLTNDGCEPLPNEADNCRLPVTVTDEEVARVVTRVPKLDTLILIKTMLKQHSFQNPFLPRRIVRSSVDAASGETTKQRSSNDISDSSNDTISRVETNGSKTEQFHKAGRSNSAPDSYEWQTNVRQISSDSLLPPVTESSSQETEIEKR